LTSVGARAAKAWRSAAVDRLKRIAFRLRSTAARALVACCVLLLAACSVARDASPSHAESRTPIELPAKERERMRAGMRAYLEAVDGITTALAENRMPGVAKSAKAVGTDMIKDVSLGDVMTLPPAFLAMSLDTHQKFDALAKDAADYTTKTAALKQLGAILANCTACHAAYRLAP
jgi:hypothetical protein